MYVVCGNGPLLLSLKIHSWFFTTKYVSTPAWWELFLFDRLLHLANNFCDWLSPISFLWSMTIWRMRYMAKIALLDLLLWMRKSQLQNRIKLSFSFFAKLSLHKKSWKGEKCEKTRFEKLHQQDPSNSSSYMSSNYTRTKTKIKYWNQLPPYYDPNSLIYRKFP